MQVCAPADVEEFVGLSLAFVRVLVLRLREKVEVASCTEQRVITLKRFEIVALLLHLSVSVLVGLFFEF